MSQAVSIHREHSGPGLLTRIGGFVPHLDAARLAYGVKVALALLIAVGVELYFNLGMADSAAICVLVVKSNLLGTTLQKSVLRMIGNLIGCTVGLVFIALFAQDRIAGTVVFSLYSAFCCFFLQRSRYAPAWHWIYDSAAIVFVFHLGSATESFIFTAERWLELSIGILSMTLVSSILWPSRAGTLFENKLLSMLKELSANVGSLHHLLTSNNGLPPTSTPEMLAAGIPALRNALDTASRDTPRYERFHEGYESVLTALQSLIARHTLFIDSMAQLADATSNPGQREHVNLASGAIAHLQALMDGLAKYVEFHFDASQTPATPPDTRVVRKAAEEIRASVTAADRSLREAATTLYLCDKIDALSEGIERFSVALNQAEQNSRAPAKFSAIQSLDSDLTPFWRRLDVRKSIVCGVTIALAFTVWILTNWPAGTFGVFFAVLITSKNCTAPYLPPKALIPGAIVGIVVGSILYLGVLPALDGFWELALVLFSLCAVGGYLMLSSNVKIAGVTGLTTIVAIKLMNVQAHQTVSFSHVVGFSYGVLGGTFLALIVLAIMWPIVPEKMFTSQVKAVVRSCRQWLHTVSAEGGISGELRAAFARQSAKQLELCVMWGKFLNYERLPAESRGAVGRLNAAIQSTLLHLIELDDIRSTRANGSHSGSLAGIAKRVDRELCDALARLADSLERCTPIPSLPDVHKLLGDLQAAFSELCEGAGDAAARRETASHALSMIGQYGALIRVLTICHEELRALDWQSLNESYF